MAAKPQCSVIIPTLGRPSLLSTLTALAEQVDPPTFEIVVVVDASQAPDLSDATLHRRCTQLRVICLGRHQGVSVARTRALDLAAGDLVGFLDDDVTPDPTWLACIERHLSGGPHAVTGRILEDPAPSHLSVLRKRAFDHRHDTNLSRRPPGGASVDYLNGGNCAARSEVLRAVGGFDPQYVKSQDRELARRVIQAGFTIEYAPNLVVHHRAAYRVADLLRGRYRAGRAAATMLRSGGPDSLGPGATRETYGLGTLGLARSHGVTVALLAILSIAARRLGRLRPWPATPKPTRTEVDANPAETLIVHRAPGA